MTNDQLELLCAERKSAVDLRNQVEEEVRRLSTLIGEEMSERGVERVELPSFTAKWITATRHTLDKFKLVEAGVPMETIEEATVESTSTFVRVDERKAEKATEWKGKGVLKQSEVA